MSRRDLADLMECHWSRIVDLENEQAEPTDSEVFAISRQLRFPLGQFTDHKKAPCMFSAVHDAHILKDMDEQEVDGFIDGL
jgi:hypothetical protein